MDENKMTVSADEAANRSEKNTEQEVPKKKKKQKVLLAPKVEYAKRMDKYAKYYVNLLAVIAVGAASAIAVAVLKDVLIGIAIAIITVLIYRYFVTDELNKSLGVAYKSCDEYGLCITRARARYGNEFWIPKKLMMMDVTEVGDGAFKSAKNTELECVHFPKTLKHIGRDIFEGCEAIRTICFEGDEKMWGEIEKETDLEEYEISFCISYPRVKKKKSWGKKPDAKKTKKETALDKESKEPKEETDK